jgi:hypothetical protein
MCWRGSWQRGLVSVRCTEAVRGVEAATQIDPMYFQNELTRAVTPIGRLHDKLSPSVFCSRRLASLPFRGRARLSRLDLNSLIHKGILDRYYHRQNRGSQLRLLWTLVLE